MKMNVEYLKKLEIKFVKKAMVVDRKAIVREKIPMFFETLQSMKKDTLE